MHYANKKATMGIHETSEIKMAVNGNIHVPLFFKSLLTIPFYSAKICFVSNSFTENNSHSNIRRPYEKAGRKDRF